MITVLLCLLFHPVFIPSTPLCLYVRAEYMLGPNPLLSEGTTDDADFKREYLAIEVTCKNCPKIYYFRNSGRLKIT